MKHDKPSKLKNKTKHINQNSKASEERKEGEKHEIDEIKKAYKI